MDSACILQSSLKCEISSIISFDRRLLLLYQIFLLFTEVELQCQPSTISRNTLTPAFKVRYEVHYEYSFFFFEIQSISRFSFEYVALHSGMH